MRWSRKVIVSLTACLGPRVEDLKRVALLVVQLSVLACVVGRTRFVHRLVSAVAFALTTVATRTYVQQSKTVLH